ILNKLFFYSICVFAACNNNHDHARTAEVSKSDSAFSQNESYQPADPALQDTIARMDSILFQAYNTCDTVTYDALFSDNDFEFYHDKGGLTTDKKASVEAFKRNVCGKVTRELLKGSIEVSPVPNFGAVEIGKHRFHNKQEPNAESHYARFVIVWKRESSGWKITRVISLH
ncbi:MAG TPA: nuclear transport factor 2 family protein, partial [Chitinophagaceae bacterium]